jgi:hypothetical protein
MHLSLAHRESLPQPLRLEVEDVAGGLVEFFLRGRQRPVRRLVIHVGGLDRHADDAEALVDPSPERLHLEAVLQEGGGDVGADLRGDLAIVDELHFGFSLEGMFDPPSL